MAVRRRWIGVTICAVVLAAGAAIALSRPSGQPSQWTVQAANGQESQETIDSIDQACGDSQEIVKKNYTARSHQIPGRPFGGPHWRVEGRGNADEVADCFRSLGMTFVEVSKFEGERRLVPTGD